MYIVGIIGSDVSIKSCDMIGAYNEVSEFAPVDAKISVKWIGENTNE